MRVRHSGFTLIELMIVVAIIGILASVAIPQFRTFQLRSKTAERSLVMSAINRAADDYFAREGRYPTITSPTTSQLSTSWNPSMDPVPYKRPMPLTMTDWAKLSLRIDGNVYYSYLASGNSGPGYRDMYTYAVGDLDGNRDWTGGGSTYCYQRHYRYWTGTSMTSDTLWDSSLAYPDLSGCY
jgi:type IV pilus assembly protein PilA